MYSTEVFNMDKNTTQIIKPKFFTKSVIIMMVVSIGYSLLISSFQQTNSEKISCFVILLIASLYIWFLFFLNIYKDKLEQYDQYLKDPSLFSKQENNNTIDKSTNEPSYAFQYIFSFIIPLVGFILGATLLSKEHEEEQSVGKRCIVLGVVSVAISVLVLMLR